MSKLEALLIVANAQEMLVIAGTGEVIDPDGGVVAIAYLNSVGEYAGCCVHDEWRAHYPNERANELVLNQYVDDVHEGIFFFTMPERIEADAAQYGLAKIKNLGTHFLTMMSVVNNMTDEQFLKPQTLLIMGLGLIAFIVDTAGGVLFAKLYNVFARIFKFDLINPMIGAAGISAFPMSGRIVHKMALKEDPENFILMHSIGVNVSGQIASVIAGALVLGFFS